MSNGASTALAARTEIGYRMSAVFAIAQRDLTKLLRDRLRMAVNLAFPVTLIVGLGHVLEPTVGQITGLNAVTLALTGVLAATMFQSAAAGMISLVEDRETDFAREMFIAPLSRITLMGGKIVGETLVALCQGGFIVVFALVFGVQVSLGQVVAELGPCIACCLLGAAFGLATLSRAAEPAGRHAGFPVPYHPSIRAGRGHRPPSLLADLAECPRLGHAPPLRRRARQSSLLRQHPRIRPGRHRRPAGRRGDHVRALCCASRDGSVGVGKTGAQPVRPGRLPSTTPPLIPLLFLLADTGGGHRSAALAVTEALERAFPGRFTPVLLDPLAGPNSRSTLRQVVRLYGPVIRLAPWAWGAIYHASDSPRAAALLQRTLLRLADRPVVHAVQQVNPAAIVSFHPLTTAAAVRAARTADGTVPVVTVVTDLITVHTGWYHAGPDHIVVPSAAVRSSRHLAGVPRERCSEIGLPVSSRFCGRRLHPTQRSALKKALGLDEGRFLVVVTGGGRDRAVSPNVLSLYSTPSTTCKSSPSAGATGGSSNRSGRWLTTLKADWSSRASWPTWPTGSAAPTPW